MDYAVYASDFHAFSATIVTLLQFYRWLILHCSCIKMRVNPMTAIKSKLLFPLLHYLLWFYRRKNSNAILYHLIAGLRAKDFHTDVTKDFLQQNENSPLAAVGQPWG